MCRISSPSFGLSQRPSVVGDRIFFERKCRKMLIHGLSNGILNAVLFLRRSQRRLFEAG